MFVIGIIALIIAVFMSLAFSLLDILETQRKTVGYPRI